MLPIIMQNETPTNPGYLVTVAQEITSINMNVPNNPISISTSQNQHQWFIDYNFNTHPSISVDGRYVTALTYTYVTPNTNSLVVASSSVYLNHAGIVLVGGLVNVIYSVTVGVTLDNSEVLTYSQKIIIGA